MSDKVYRSVLARWNTIAVNSGLTQQHLVILAAQFAGKVIRKAPDMTSRIAQAEVASRALQTYALAEDGREDDYFRENAGKL